MRDILTGGVLVTPAASGPIGGKTVYSRRRHTARPRSAVRPVVKAPCNDVQPGQLASPFLKFGFPSLALH